MYRNNPDAVCDITVDVTQAEPELHAALRSAARRILQESDEGARWKLATDEDITVTQLTGGITNVLFLLSLKSDGDSKVIVRLYGQGTSAFIDRTVENFVFSKLSILGIGPTFHGRFTNGRVEGYLPATALESSEMGDADVFPHIARAVAELHGLDFPEIRGTGWLWAKIRNFLRLAAEGKCKGKTVSTL
jgi:ethanolamine kinase